MLVRWRSLVCLFFVALFVRTVIVCMALWDVGPLGQLTDDPDAYRIIAETLARTGVFGIAGSDGGVDPTAFRPPLYPWLLSWLVSSDGELSLIAVAALHALLGAITAVATTVAVVCWAGELKLKARAGILAGVLVTIDPLLLMQSTLVMTETLATAIAALAWMMIALAGTGADISGANVSRANSARLQWVWWFGASVLLAAGFLCRPTFVVWTLGLLLVVAARIGWSLVRYRTLAWRELLIGSLIVVTSGVTVLGWMERNRRAIGRPVWATTHGGYTLLLGNNPYFYQYLQQRSFAEAGLWGAAWDAEPFHQDWQRRQTELRLQFAERPPENLSFPADIGYANSVDYEAWEDRAAGEWSKETIRQQPGMFFYSSLVRVARLWTPVPRVGQQVSAISLLLGVYYTLIYVACLIVVSRLLWTSWRDFLGGNQHRSAAGVGSWVTVSALLLVCSLTLVHAVYWSNVRMRAPAMPIILGLGSLGIVGGFASPLGRGKH